MKAKERFEKIIQMIEAEARNPYIDPQELADKVAMQNGVAFRDLNTIFNFLTDIHIRAYIKERKMMAAYSYLIGWNKLRIDGAVAISGKGTASSFNRAFKDTFGITPSEAFRDKDETRIVPPLSWGDISCETEYPLTAEEEVEQMKDMNVFGIPKEQYERALEATELAEFYGFEQQESSVAFDLATVLELPLKATFRFVSELLEFGEELDEETGLSYDEENFLADVHDPLLQFLFFKCNLHVCAAYETIDRLGLRPEDIMAKDPVTLHIYANTPDVRFAFLENAMAYYYSRADEDYDEDNLNSYIDMICSDIPKETAFERLIPNGAIIDPPTDAEFRMDLEEDTFNYPFDDMELEESRWRGQRIDIEADPDNLAYEEDDNSGPLDF